MKKKRIIPLVLFRGGYVVQSRQFRNHKQLGLLGPTLTRLEEWGADEIMIVNISESKSDSDIQVGRTDIADEFAFDFAQAIKFHAGFSSVPVTVGGGIRSFNQVARLFEIGADKILINTAFHKDKHMVRRVAREFGSQAIVLGVDYAEAPGGQEVHISSGREPTGQTVSEVLDNAAEIGVGEFFLNSIDRDGMKSGLDLETVSRLGTLQVPLIICGGVGEAGHIADGLALKGVDGVSAANYFHHVENSIQLARHSALAAGILVRSF